MAGLERSNKAFHPGASGDISADSNTYFAWQSPRGGSYVPTPIVYEDNLYSCMDNALLTCFDAKTGKQIYQHRINGKSIGFSASPVAMDGKLEG